MPMTDNKRNELRGDIDYFLTMKDHMCKTKEGIDYGTELLNKFPIDEKSTLEDITRVYELMQFYLSNL